MGMTDRQLLWQVELPLALPGDHRRAADRDRVHGRAGDARGVRRRRRARRRDRRLEHHLQDGIIIAGGLAILIAIELRPHAGPRAALPERPWRGG